jgi:hypothetical protein
MLLIKRLFSCILPVDSVNVGVIGSSSSLVSLSSSSCSSVELKETFDNTDRFLLDVFTFGWFAMVYVFIQFSYSFGAI